MRIESEILKKYIKQCKGLKLKKIINLQIIQNKKISNKKDKTQMSRIKKLKGLTYNSRSREREKKKWWLASNRRCVQCMHCPIVQKVSILFKCYRVGQHMVIRPPFMYCLKGVRATNLLTYVQHVPTNVFFFKILNIY